MDAAAWKLVRRQYGLVTRRQLLGLGFSRRAIEHRIATGRLHPIHRGVYAVGRRELSRNGFLMAAILSCGDHAVLSHSSAGALWEIFPYPARAIEISVISGAHPRRPGISLHQRRTLSDVTSQDGIPVTSPACTLVDLATRLSSPHLERAIDEAVIRGLTDPDALRATVADMHRRPGARAVAKTLDDRTFALTDSVLEQRFLPIARAAGLPAPITQARVNGFRVDFHWPALGLVVETDGLRYHRTPSQQARDRLRDQAHAAAGLVGLRFTHDQIAHAPHHVEQTLAAVATQRARAADSQR